MGKCPHCDAEILVFKGGKAKLRTNIVVIHKSGALETNCPACRKAVELPVSVDAAKPLRKSDRGLFGVPLDMSKKHHS